MSYGGEEYEMPYTWPCPYVDSRADGMSVRFYHNYRSTHWHEWR